MSKCGVASVVMKNCDLFESLGVLTRAELEARSNVFYADYCHKVVAEAKVLAQMVDTGISPAVAAYQSVLATSLSSTVAAAKAAIRAAGPSRMATANQSQQFARYVSLHDTAIKQSSELKHLVEETEELSSLPKRAAACEKRILPLMASLRSTADELETVTPGGHWPFPSYRQILFHQD